MEQVKSGFRGQNGCQGDGDGDGEGEGDGDQAANTVRANALTLQEFKVAKNNL